MSISKKYPFANQINNQIKDLFHFHLYVIPLLTVYRKRFLGCLQSCLFPVLQYIQDFVPPGVEINAL